MSQQTIGAVPQNVKRNKIVTGGEWAETPYFGPGLLENSENMIAFPKGMTLAGTLKAIRETKAEKAKDRKRYLCLEDFSGNKFRVSAPGQLVYLAEQAGLGTPIAITYMGKEVVEGYKDELHQFEVESLEEVQ